MTINCQNQNPTILIYDKQDSEWILVPFSELDNFTDKDVVNFQYSSISCQATNTPETINGFTYGEIVICFFLIIFSMALIFGFLFKYFIKNI